MTPTDTAGQKSAEETKPEAEADAPETAAADPKPETQEGDEADDADDADGAEE